MPPLAADLGHVSEFDQRVYKAIASYAWDEAECHPSQATIAREVGCARESVNRAVRRLKAAGWLAIKERRWSPRSGWCHNVYELLAPFVVGVPTIKRIVRRAHNTPKRRAARLVRRADHTNTKWSGRGTPGWCGCTWCKHDRGSIGRPPPPIRPPASTLGSIAGRVEQRLREKYGDRVARIAVERGWLELSPVAG